MVRTKNAHQIKALLVAIEVGKKTDAHDLPELCATLMLNQAEHLSMRAMRQSSSGLHAHGKNKRELFSVLCALLRKKARSR